MQAGSGRVGGKFALITGGASGIGAATARALAREGAAVIITDLDRAGGEKVVSDIAGNGGKALFLHHDVTSEAGWKAVIDAAIAAFGRIDIGVNNAGISGGLFDLMTASLDDWRKVMAINLDGVFLGMRHFGPAMAERGGGSIVNISSIMGQVGAARAAAYCASKGGVTLLTKAAALEWAGVNIRVNSVHPGYVETPLLGNTLARGGNDPALREKMIALHPLGRFGMADDIARAVLFLASEESSFMTGSEVVVDGGYTAA